MRLSDIAEKPSEVGVVTEVKDGAFCMGDNSWLGIPEGTKPQVEDSYAIWGQFGRPVRGVAFNGDVSYYRTESEQHAKDQAEIAERKADGKARFLAREPDYRARIEALPEPFRKRFERFQAGNPEFDWEYGGYELFCCEEAVVIATHFDCAGNIVKWNGLDYSEQKAELPELKYSDHSGNTFGAAVSLAIQFKSEIDVALTHGALTPLVGCDAYGCTHAALPSNTEEVGG